MGTISLSIGGGNRSQLADKLVSILKMVEKSLSIVCFC